MSSLNLPVFSCSLDPASVSRRLAEHTADAISSQGHRSTVVDLADVSLPPFDNDGVFDSDVFSAVHRVIDEADGVVLAFPDRKSVV